MSSKFIGLTAATFFSLVSGWSSPKAAGSESTSEDLNDADIEPLVIDRGPYFDKTASANVTALVGKTAYLNCKVRNLGNKTVSFTLSSVLFGLNSYVSLFTLWPGRITKANKHSECRVSFMKVA